MQYTHKLYQSTTSLDAQLLKPLVLNQSPAAVWSPTCFIKHATGEVIGDRSLVELVWHDMEVFRGEPGPVMVHADINRRQIGMFQYEIVGYSKY